MLQRKSNQENFYCTRADIEFEFENLFEKIIKYNQLQTR